MEIKISNRKKNIFQEKLAIENNEQVSYGNHVKYYSSHSIVLKEKNVSNQSLWRSFIPQQSNGILDQAKRGTFTNECPSEFRDHSNKKANNLEEKTESGLVSVH